MTLPLVNLEQAKKLKELGFDWPTYDYYFKDRLWAAGGINKYGEMGAGIYSAPTVALALRWLREVKGIIVWTSIGSQVHVYTSGGTEIAEGICRKLG